jgi:hypothetical protein
MKKIKKQHHNYYTKKYHSRRARVAAGEQIDERRKAVASAIKHLAMQRGPVGEVVKVGKYF